jgi:hypothetical protein
VRYLVWVDAWQLQCCGEPFSVGGEVTWTLSDEPNRQWLADVVGAPIAGSVTHAEQHHGPWPLGQVAVVFTGRVGSIQSVFCRFAPGRTNDGILVPVPGSGVLHDVSRADGWEKEADDLPFKGYLVTLDVDHEPG